MWRYILVAVFIFQALVAAAMLGTAIHDARQYKVPFGRLFLSEEQQVIVMFWLIASLFANVCFIAVMQ